MFKETCQYRLKRVRLLIDLTTSILNEDMNSENAPGTISGFFQANENGCNLITKKRKTHGTKRQAWT
jgi:hypothetical protein